MLSERPGPVSALFEGPDRIHDAGLGEVRRLGLVDAQEAHAHPLGHGGADADDRDQRHRQQHHQDDQRPTILTRSHRRKVPGTF